MNGAKELVEIGCVFLGHSDAPRYHLPKLHPLKIDIHLLRLSKLDSETRATVGGTNTKPSFERYNGLWDIPAMISEKFSQKYCNGNSLAFNQPGFLGQVSVKKEVCQYLLLAHVAPNKSNPSQYCNGRSSAAKVFREIGGL